MKTLPEMLEATDAAGRRHTAAVGRLGQPPQKDTGHPLLGALPPARPGHLHVAGRQQLPETAPAKQRHGRGVSKGGRQRLRRPRARPLSLVPVPHLSMAPLPPGSFPFPPGRWARKPRPPFRPRLRAAGMAGGGDVGRPPVAE